MCEKGRKKTGRGLLRKRLIENIFFSASPENGLRGDGARRVMRLREWIERRELACFRELYGSGVVWPNWKQLMAELPEDEIARTLFFKNASIRVWRQIKLNDDSIKSEDDGGEIGELLNFMSTRAVWFAHEDLSEIGKSIGVQDESVFALESVARKGWTREIASFASGIGSGVETVDVHSVKTAILAGLMSESSFERLFLMGLVHDHAEQWIGDLTPSEVVDRAAKKRMELDVYREKIGASGLSEKKKKLMIHAFEMCIEDDSVESCLIHIADKLDMAMQAWAYEREFGIPLQAFFDSAGQDIERAFDKMMTLKKFCDTP